MLFLFTLITSQNLIAQNTDTTSNNKINIRQNLHPIKIEINLGIECLLYKDYNLSNEEKWYSGWHPNPKTLTERMLSELSSEQIKEHSKFKRKLPLIGLSITKKKLTYSLACSYRNISNYGNINDLCFVDTKTQKLNFYNELNYLISENKRISPFISIRLKSTYIKHIYQINNHDPFSGDFEGDIESKMFFKSIQPGFGIKTSKKKYSLTFGIDINTFTYAFGKYSYSANHSSSYTPEYNKSKEEKNIPVSLVLINKQFFYDLYFRINFNLSKNKEQINNSKY